MEQPFLKVRRLDKRATLPSKRDEDAGYDLYAVLEEDFFLFKPGQVHLFPTKISIEIPRDWVFYIAERGSTGSKGISRRCGVIDSGYRGEIFVALNNTSDKPVVFFKEDNEALDKFLEENNLSRDNATLYPQSKGIAQGMLMYCPHVEVEEVQGLSESIRGEGVLGSSQK